MDESTFIQVILPLKLEWEPYYLVETPVVAGSRVKVEFAGKDYTAVVSAVGVTPPEHLVDKILYIKAIERELPPVFEQEIAFWRSLATYYLCTIGEVYKAALLRDRVAAELPKAASEAGREVQLSREQEQAAAAVRAAFGAGKTVLLHGVTGAGKTELYLQLARETLAEGKSVLFLVPEIALSRQLEDRVTAVFPGTLVYHSAKTWPRRAAVTKAVLEAPQYLVLGTRSALFLPHRNLGLIIVDEEHDNSFKQDSPAPRYHARESAIMLSLVQGAHVILGSATPSLESLYNAENGKFVKVDLKQRFHKGKEAEVLIVDTVAERRKNGMTGSLSLKLLKELSRTLEAGGQAVLLRSRRSYTGKCDHCGGALQPLGAGTQKIEEELQALYPRARIARLDSDATQAEARTIRQFAKGEIDILVGTQVVTKGFDFAGVSLVAVIQADNILGQQDFRADEHAIQRLEQFRGRSGRRGTPGLFVIQTREPNHPVFARLGEQADNTAQLLEERRLFGYPPYTRLIHLTLKDANEKRLNYLARELAQSLPLPSVGPYTPTVDKIADQYIRQIRIMLPRDKFLQERKRQLLQAINLFEKTHKYTGHLIIDVDPI